MEFSGVLKENGRKMPSILSVLKSVAVAYGITILFLFIFAILVTYTDFPEGFVSAVVLVMTVLSVMLSGVLTARGNKTQGWLCGALSGVLYMMLLYVLSSLAFDYISFCLNTVSIFLIGLFSGTFGGIIGINMKGAKRR